MSRTNVVFLHSHNTGRFVQPYGHAVPTPHLQRLAEQGVLFRQAFAAAPTCSPSRASFLTGMYPHSCGQLGLAHRGFGMTDYSRHLVHGMKRAGYHTVLSGVEHTAPDVAVVGYDEVVCDHDTNYPGSEPAGTEPADTAGAAAAFIRGRHRKPFFISIGLNETHRPFPRADPAHHPAEDERFCRPPAPLPDTPATRRDTADFKAAARVMDAGFGRVLRALDDAGLADDTLVLCFSDHGLQFPRNMCNLTDQGIGVYLVARGPGGFRGGRAIDALVSLIDLAPTAYAAAGVDVPDFVEGRPLQPLARGEVDALHEQVHAEINYHAAYEPARCIRTERYKYIRRYDDYGRVVLSNADDGPSKEELLFRGWDGLPREREMLYDLMFDPTEQHNVVARPDLRPVAADLRGRLDRWMKATGDPLLAGRGGRAGRSADHRCHGPLAGRPVANAHHGLMTGMCWSGSSVTTIGPRRMSSPT